MSWDWVHVYSFLIATVSLVEFESEIQAERKDSGVRRHGLKNESKTTKKKLTNPTLTNSTFYYRKTPCKIPETDSQPHFVSLSKFSSFCLTDDTCREGAAALFEFLTASVNIHVAWKTYVADLQQKSESLQFTQLLMCQHLGSGWMEMDTTLASERKRSREWLGA